MTRFRTFAALVVVALLLALASNWLSRPGKVLYVGGPILTMDADNRVVEALATDGDRIVAAGAATELRAWAEQAGARVVELRGRALVPGFVDAHSHFPGSGIYSVYADLNSPPIGEIDTIEQVVAVMRTRAESVAAGDWLVGMGYDDTLLEELRHPTRRDLDRASVDHPIAVLHISGHLAVVNSAALEKLGIDRNTDDPEGGVIRRDPSSGEPNGVLEETAMQDLHEFLKPGGLEGLQIVRDAGRIYAKAGVTTAQSGMTSRGLMLAYAWMSRLGLFPIRLVAWPDESAADAMLSGDFVFSSPDPQWLRAGAVKLLADGSIQGYTGYLREPYAVPPGDDVTFRGYPRISRDELARSVGRFHAAGLQVAVHGNGDASIDDILDAFEAAQRAHPRDDTRHVIIHAQMARDDQLDRMKALGIIPSFFSLHTFYWGDRHRRIFMGPERASRMSPAGSAVERDMHFTIHTDAPVVPMEPLRLVWSAVNRRSRTGHVLGEGQRISAMRALRAVTIDAAYQHFEDDEKGSLEPGKLADLVILSSSPIDDPANIDRIRVVETLVGGRSIYASGEGS